MAASNSGLSALSASQGILSKIGMPVDPVTENLKMLKKFKASKDAKALVDWVIEQHRKCKSARTREVQQWNYNLAMYFGNQNIQIFGPTSPNAGKFYNPVSKPGSPDKMIINRIRPLVRTELARILSQKPAASVVPATSDDEDMMAALAGEQVWESLYSRKKFHTHFSRAAFWQVVTGNGFIKTSWDDNSYDVFSKQTGDITFSSIQPYNLFIPDLLESEIENQQYVLEVQIKPVDWVNYIFKDSLDKPAVATATAATSLLEEAYLTQRGDNAAKPDSVIIYEMWIKAGACKWLPDGGHVMIVNNEIISMYNEGLPYEHGEYPYAKFEHVPTAKFYADSVVVDVTPLQKEYNTIRSQVADNRRKMGNLQWNAHKGAILPEKFTNAVGQFNLIRPGMQFPQQVQPAQLPSYILDNLNRTLSDVEDITGQHAVSKGNTPPGITAATAISYLQERDDSLLTHTYQSIEQGMEKIAKQALLLAVQFWDSPRLVRTVGADNAFDTTLLQGSDLVNGTDIRIEAGSALPQSKAAKQAFIMDLMKMGFIDPDSGLEMLEIGGAQKLIESLHADERQAQRENIKLKGITEQDIMAQQQAWQQAVAAGDPKTIDQNTQSTLDVPPIIPVNSYDNHKVHIAIHNKYRRGQAFEILSDTIKAQFEAHVNMHKKMLVQDQTQQMIDSIPADPNMGAQPGGPAPQGDPTANAIQGQQQQGIPGQDPNAAPIPGG